MPRANKVNLGKRVWSEASPCQVGTQIWSGDGSDSFRIVMGKHVARPTLITCAEDKVRTLAWGEGDSEQVSIACLVSRARCATTWYIKHTSGRFTNFQTLYWCVFQICLQIPGDILDDVGAFDAHPPLVTTMEMGTPLMFPGRSVPIKLLCSSSKTLWARLVGNMCLCKCMTLKGHT